MGLDVVNTASLLHRVVSAIGVVARSFAHALGLVAASFHRLRLLTVASSESVVEACVVALFHVFHGPKLILSLSSLGTALCTSTGTSPQLLAGPVSSGEFTLG